MLESKENKEKIELPRHLGLILDGNRRWATEQNLPTLKGHYQGAEVLKDISLAAFRYGVPYVSAFVFSTENWARSKTEVSYLMRLIIKFVDKYLAELSENKVRVVHVGARDGLPKAVLQALDKAVKHTAKFDQGTLALCINYGGQQEIVDAAKLLLRRGVNPNRLSVHEFEQYLYAPDLPPVDLVVRTSGEYRISGFMLWRAAYAEYIFVDKHWPAFTKRDLRTVLLYYAKRQRRFGR
ncbi:MAG: polyprenyl diphosphate synthase [Candidatus Saccharimonadales bacterium]